ncbi:MAG: efflux RND transporter permease subunit [Acidobacteriota bacterium]
MKGAPVFIRDVGRVEDSHQIQTNVVRVNGKRQVYIPIYRQPGANTLQIVDSIRDRLQRILQRLRELDPRAETLQLELVMDQSVYVRQSVQGLQLAAGLGALLAALVVLLFLRSLRSTFIIFLAIPLSLLAAFTGLFFSGDTINAMTLGGLALAVGILVDQSIVVLENTMRHLGQGKAPLSAALDASREVAFPLLISTITFIVVFFPVVFLSGLAKFLFTPLALAATFAMGASYFIAITLIPAFCARYLKPDRAESQEGTRPPLVRAYGLLLAATLRRRFITVLGASALFVLSLFLLAHMGTEMFPRVDAGQFTLFVRLPSGTRIEATEQTVARIEQTLMEVIGKPDPEYPAREEHPESDLRVLISNIGVLLDWPAAYTPNSGPMDAFVLVQLKGRKGSPGTFEYADKLRKRLSEEFPWVEFAFSTGGMLTSALNFGEPSPIHIQVSGSRLETSLEVARIIRREAAKVAGAVDLRIAQRLDYPIVDIDIDRAKAAFLGLTVEDVVKNIVTATNSSVNFDPAFWIDHRNGNHYFIGAQYLEKHLLSMETLRDIPITGANSRQAIPLRNVARFRRTTGPATISHRNITRVVDVYANVARGYDAGSVMASIENSLQEVSELGPAPRQTERGVAYEVTGPEFRGKGYAFEISGEMRTMREAFSQFGNGLLIAVILVYLIMVAQFRSFLDPFVVLLTVPLGFVGVVFLLFFTDTHLSIQSFMGIIMMVGIVVEYSIVLVDFANGQLRKGGTTLEAAMTSAARIRLRPILMTSLTTVLALAPMAFGFGGGDANIPLARAIVGGVLGATILSLFVVPCLYVMLKRSPHPAQRIL